MKVLINVKPNLKKSTIETDKTLVLTPEDYAMLDQCLEFVKELYNAVVHEGAVIRPNETHLWRLLNQTEVINEQHKINKRG